MLDQIDENAVVSSPGMKYKHYAPRAHVVIVDADDAGYADYVNSHGEPGVYALCFEEDVPSLKTPSVTFGSKDDQASQARLLFDALRLLDVKNAKLVLARCPQKDHIGLAVCNRLLRSAGFEVVQP